MAKVIAVEDIQDGMINAEPIINRYGQTLLAAGVVLNQQHATFLKNVEYTHNKSECWRRRRGESGNYRRNETACIRKNFQKDKLDTTNSN